MTTKRVPPSDKPTPPSVKPAAGPAKKVSSRAKSTTKRVATQVKPPKPPQRRRWWKWAVGLGGIVLLGAVAFLIYLRTRPPLIPAAIRQQVSFQLYYPTNLPSGLSVDPNSFASPQKNVITFVVHSGNSKIVVSEEPRPTDAQLNIQTFLTTNVLAPVAFLSPVGQATVGHLANGEQIGSLVTDIWIIVTAPPNVGIDQVHAVVSAMQPYTP